MKLLYIGNYMFEEIDGEFYGLPSSSNTFFEKYLCVFDEVRVIGEHLALDIVDAWLNTDFEAERHLRRVNLIE